MGFSLKADTPKAATNFNAQAATPLQIEETTEQIKRKFENAEQLTRAYTPEEVAIGLDNEKSAQVKPQGFYGDVKPAAKAGLGGFKFKAKPSTDKPKEGIVPAVTAETRLGIGDSLPTKVHDAAPQESMVEEPLTKTLMPNEVPAEAVVREIADDASPGILKFIEMLDAVPKLFHDPDTLGQVIRNIMVSLSEEESFIEMVQPDDYKFIIRGMRDVLEGAAIKKASTKRKSSSKRKPKKTDLDSDDLAMLDDLMSGI